MSENHEVEFGNNPTALYRLYAEDGRLLHELVSSEPLSPVWAGSYTETFDGTGWKRVWNQPLTVVQAGPDGWEGMLPPGNLRELFRGGFADPARVEAWLPVVAVTPSVYGQLPIAVWPQEANNRIRIVNRGKRRRVLPMCRSDSQHA